MPEIRKCPISGRWVIVEEEQASLGPDDYEKTAHKKRGPDICQFCYGKEENTPPEVDAIRPDGSPPNTPGWFARVVPNKFPALKIEGDLDKRGIGMYDISNGVGAHEVLIEGPDHFKGFADFTPQEIVNVIRLYQNRTISLAKDRRFKYIMIFKNYGESAGASVEHTHSQIIALPMVPRYVLEEMEGSQGYFNIHGRCIYCDIIQQEYEDKERIIAENNDYIAFSPFVPRYPFESWILPKEHNSDFCSLTEEGRLQLAGILKEMLTRLKVCLDDPSYNFYLHLVPVNYGRQASFHWHIEIVPQLVREVGFEWGTEFYVVRTSPAVAAKSFREVKIL